MGIPTVITLRDGKEVGRVTGSQNETNYRMMFEALAEGREVKVPLTQFDRMLRLGAGALFAMVGISTHNWIVGGIGGIIAFMGIYDRCPIWKALTGMLKRS
jgi:thioredoxin 1